MFKNELTNNQKLVFISLLSAVGAVLMLIEIPYFSSYLKLDISDVTVLLASTISFPAAIAVSIIKTLALFLLKPSDPLGIVIALLASSLLAGLYRLASIKLSQVKSLIAVVIILPIILTALNLFIFIPLYSKVSFFELSSSSEYWISNIILFYPFNVIKFSIVSVLYLVVSKRFNRGD